MVLPSLKSLKTLFGSPKRRRAGSGRKHKEKVSSESQELPDGSREPADRASKMGHQVHPEHRPAITIDKVNVMVNLDGKWDKKDLDLSPMGEDAESLADKLRTSPGVGKEPATGKTTTTTSHAKEASKGRTAPFSSTLCQENRVSTDSVAVSDRDTWISGQSDKEIWALHHSEKDSSDRSSYESDKSGSWLANESELDDVKCSYNHRERPVGEDREHSEKTDVIKELLEKRVLELEHLLEKEKKNEWHSQQEILQKELETERSQRQEVESRLQEISQENELAKTRLSKLQQDFTKLEEMVCGMIQYKSRMDWMQQEKAAISLSYEARLRKYQSYISNLEKENLMLLGEVKSLEASNKQNDDRERSLSQVLLERLRYLETENSSLVLETEQQRLQYERCLDDVANQVVQALLMQKGLREECMKLRKHVGDLEQQNRMLRLMFQKQINSQADSAQQSPTFSNSKLVARVNASKGSNHSSMATQTSHSEDSLESLASLCSEYSLHSNGSGSIHSNSVGINVPGMPQLSSPPLWIRECLMQCRSNQPASRRSQDCDELLFSNINAISQEAKASMELDAPSDTIWPGLHLRDLEELVAGDETHCGSRGLKVQNKMDDDSKSIEGRAENSQIEEIRLDTFEAMWEKNSGSLPDGLDSLSAIETPKDEPSNFVSLPLPISNQNLCLSTFHPSEQLSQTLKSLGMRSVTENVQQRLRDVVSRNIALRPKSLNLLPHSEKPFNQQEILGHHYDYPSLEFKNHLLCSGNVYTSPSMKSFPSNPSLLPSALCKDPTEMKQKHSTMATTQCRCKNVEVGSPSSKTSGDESGVGSSEVSPKVSSGLQTADGYCSFLECSTTENVGVKDEGYSTMSSEVGVQQVVVDSVASTIAPSYTTISTTTTTTSMETGTIIKRKVQEQVERPISEANEAPCAIDGEEDEEDDDGECCNAFERDLEQSLIIVNESCAEAAQKEDDITNVAQLESVPQPSETETVRETTNSPRLLASRMVSLCAPQGFKARPPLITFPLPHSGVEMADKGTETEPCTETDLSESNVSLASMNSSEPMDGGLFQSDLAACEELKSQRSSFASDSDCVELLTRSSLLLGGGKLSELKIVEDNDSDEFFLPISCGPPSEGSNDCSSYFISVDLEQKSRSDSNLLEAMARELTDVVCSRSLDNLQNAIHCNFVALGSMERLHQDDDSDRRQEGALWRSKATISLLDNEYSVSKSGLKTGELFDICSQSLTSLQSITSEDGNFKHEEPASCLLEEETYKNSTMCDSDLSALEDSESVSECVLSVNEQLVGKKFVRERNHTAENLRDKCGSDDTFTFLPQMTILPAIEEGELSEGQEEDELTSSKMTENEWLTSANDAEEQQCLNEERADSKQSSDDSELRHVGTGFHSDFYHLCNVDSLSLNVSNKSLSASEAGSYEKEQSPGNQRRSAEGESVKCISSDDSSLPSSDKTVIEVWKDETSSTVGKSLESENVANGASSHENVEVDTENRHLSDDSSQDGDEDVAAANVQCTLRNEASTREKLQELSALLANSNGADEEEELVTTSKQQLAVGPQGKEGCTTSWVHVETDVDLTDPKARANLLDTMLASSSSSSSSSSECGEEPPEYHHLHQLHRYRRHRKATELENCILRYIPPARPSIIGRRDFYFRYGEQEQAAVASFDFLEDLSTSVSDMGDQDATEDDNDLLATNMNHDPNKEAMYLPKMLYGMWPQKQNHRTNDDEDDQVEDADELSMTMTTSTENLHAEFNGGSTTTLNSHDCEVPERLSLSDSCAESYSSSSQSLNTME